MKAVKDIRNQIDIIERETVDMRPFWGEEVLTYLDDKRKQLKEGGLWLPQIPEEWGGMGLSLKKFGRVSEMLGRSFYGHYLFNCQAPDAGNMEILIEHGTREQQDEFLRPLLAGNIRSCFAMTEPENPGSNPILMSSVAKEDGDHYVINGHKWFTSGADGATFAIAMVLTDPENENPYLRASQIIVPVDTPGYEFVRNIPVMGEEGHNYASHAEIRFNDCKVPKANLLGEAGAGFAIAQNRLGPGRIHHCMRWIGICEKAFELMCRRAATREISPGKKLADKQTIQNWIAECRAEINAARLMVLNAADKIDEKGTKAAKVEISTIKFYVAQVLDKVLDCAIQTHGAMGVTDDTVLAYWYRHERGARIYDGADEVHKSRVAREILKNFNPSL